MEIEQHTRPRDVVIERLMTIPSIGRRVPEVILAEVGPDAQAFATPEQFSSWAGLRPGNKSSAGKRMSGRIRPGQSLRTPMVWAGPHPLNERGAYDEERVLVPAWVAEGTAMPTGAARGERMLYGLMAL